jgi:spore germination protein YaaH
MKNIKKIWLKIAVVIVLLIIAGVVLLVSPNFKKDPNEGKINFIINNNNVTGKLKHDIWINENSVVYASMEDLENYFDGQIYYDKENNQIITTSDTKVAVFSLTEKKMTLNGSEVKLVSGAVKQDGVYYLPISEMEKVYNLEITNIDNQIITLDSLDRELIKADVTKNLSVKYNTKFITKTVDKLKKGEKVVVISEKDGYAKIRTENGKIGYIKADKLTNKTTVREKMEQEVQVEGKINLVWDYYSEYVSAPERTGTIEGVNVVSPSFFSLKNVDGLSITDNASKGGTQYVSWAKANGYKVWAMFSNNSYKDVTSTILNSYELRTQMIDKIVELAVKYQVDGINVDFENMNKEDQGVYSRFIIELAPRLREYGIVTSVDVTAPDGSDTWSLCFDRDVLADAADYLVFMAYDQYSGSSTSAGTTAGADWVETNIKKFIGQEAVAKEKIILGMPLYTRLWKTDSTGKVTSSIINMNKIDSIIPDGVTRTWDDATKQYYAEWEKNGYKYQMWIEDASSIEEKLNLINTYELAGGAFWEKDRETDDIWTLAAEKLR